MSLAPGAPFLPPRQWAHLPTPLSPPHPTIQVAPIEATILSRPCEGFDFECDCCSCAGSDSDCASVYSDCSHTDQEYPGFSQAEDCEGVIGAELADNDIFGDFHLLRRYLSFLYLHHQSDLCNCPIPVARHITAFHAPLRWQSKRLDIGQMLSLISSFGGDESQLPTWRRLTEMLGFDCQKATSIASRIKRFYTGV
ncbi:hypothetical protein HK105_202851 [Polyrhizophydium stewartii]|uniref:Uncharacterized protein n=1 Tax=Polyrhizophydium stewartii TaxID=2732419 RepID=A0ABR4NDN6_9FUNG